MEPMGRCRGGEDAARELRKVRKVRRRRVMVMLDGAPDVCHISTGGLAGVVKVGAGRELSVVLTRRGAGKVRQGDRRVLCGGSGRQGLRRRVRVER